MKNESRETQKKADEIERARNTRLAVDQAIMGLPERDLLTPGEVADFFTVSKETVYLWFKKGRIEGVRPGRGGLRIFKASVEGLLCSPGEALSPGREKNGLPDKNSLTLHEVADFFSVSLQTVYRWYRKGRLKGAKPDGGVLRILKTSVEDLLRDPSGKAR